MKFIHLSDTHLGYHHLGLKERKEDFYQAFSYALNFATENGVDFIIHTGDFFHSSRPSNETIIEAISLLRKAKNIPMYTIPGNHDRGSGVRDRTALDILQEFGLYQIESGHMVFEDINIFGIKHIQKSQLRQVDLKSILQQLLEKAEKREFNILMLHLEFLPFFHTDLMLENILPEGFDYVGIGHYHQAQKPSNLNGSTVVYPGSTEYTQFNEKDYSKKGFYLVEIDSHKNTTLKFVEIPVRQFIIKKFDDDSLEEVLKELKETDTDEVRKPVLVLKGTTRKSLTKKDVLSLVDEKKLTDRFLHISVDLDRIGLEYDFKYIEDIKTSQSQLYSIVEKNIDQPDIRHKIFQLLEVVPTFENMAELENYIEENPHLFDL